MTNTEIKTKNQPKKKAANIQVDKLRTFKGHPFKVLDNEDMNNLTESIKAQGIISPLIVRAIESTDEYEVISGHRRLHAAVKAGLSEVPALIYPLDRSEAMIAVVDSNLHRERLLPSEKAFAYKMKMDAMILSRLVDTFSSRILYPMLLLSRNHSIAVVLSWEEAPH